MLELRASFPITLTGNPNIKIGEFAIAMTTNFGEGAQPKRQEISLDDSFEANEQLAAKLASQDIIEKSFPDDRIAASLQRDTKTTYNMGRYNQELDERPIRQAPAYKQSPVDDKENKRDLINVDESDQTIQNDAMRRLLDRAKNLDQMMGQTVEND